MMHKILKIAIILTIVIGIWMNLSYAETTNLYNDVVNETANQTDDTGNSTTPDTTENNTTNQTAEDNLTNDEDEDLETNTVSSDQTSSSANNYHSNSRVSTVSSIPEANLGLNNILCIILIAIGILIILLAIAILLRIKKD